MDSEDIDVEALLASINATVEQQDEISLSPPAQT